MQSSVWASRGAGYAAPAIVCDAEKLSQIAIIQDLGRLGVPVVAVSADPAAAGFASRFVRERLRLAARSHEREYVLALVERRQCGVVVPSNDANVENLARHHALLAAAGLRVYTPGNNVLDALINKQRLYEVCRECGVTAPRSMLVRTEAELEAAAGLFAYPLLLKPTNLAGGVYRLVRDRSALGVEFGALRALLLSETYRHREAGIVVQEWIPQEQAELWNITACAAEGEITSFAMGRRVRTERRRDGTIGSALLYGVSAYDEEVLRLTQRLVRHVGYRGLVECEWSKHVGGGRGAVLYDVNPRPSGNIRWALGSGAPLVEQYYRLALGMELGRAPAMREGVAYCKLFWSQTDVGGALENPACSLVGVLRVVLQNVWALLPFGASVVDVWDRGDPGPTWAVLRKVGARLWRGARRRLRLPALWRAVHADGA